MQQQQGLTVIGDLGGTHIRLACLDGPDAPLQSISVYRCAEFGRLGDVLDHYLSALGLADAEVTHIGLALPGAVNTEPVHLVNLPWQISRVELTQRFAADLLLVNDFTAQAAAIPAFAATDLVWLRGREACDSAQTRAIIGPGTGLGVAGLLADGGIVDSEAGHIGYAPGSEEQQRLLSQLRHWFPRVSNERLVSGPGLANLFRAMTVLAGAEQQLTPEQITAGAAQGHTLCLAAVNEFARIFGSVCGDLALALGATGGVYLSGGVIDKLGTLFNQELFMSEFDRKGRYTDYCRAIPLARVVCAHPGLLGMARLIQAESSRQTLNRVDV